ncbi:MAG: hypothetical protein H3Z50_00500 [archaeon]|nr:hypothetical protein [archaeon]MCP8305691.1 hypothetical protein [archaeon]
MKYVIGLETPTEVEAKLFENPEEVKRDIRELVEQAKPEAIYFSTVRRYAFFVVNVEDPHVELRKIMVALSKYGKVTVDPVSALEEFLAFVEKLS